MFGVIEPSDRALTIATTRELDRRAVNAQQHATVFAQLKSELRAALLEDPRRTVWTPGFYSSTTPAIGRSHDSALGVIEDHFAGPSGTEHLLAMLRIVGARAKAGYADALALIDALADQHAAFHVDDAVEA